VTKLKSQNLLDNIKKFKNNLKIQPFILLARPNKSVYVDESEKKLFIHDLKNIVNKGLINLEVPWEDNHNWLDLMSDLRSGFPDILLGSASVLNKKSINDSLRVGLNFSMMRFWQKELYIYARNNSYLLVPGLNKIKDFKEATSHNCQIIKIFPVNNKEDNLDIKRNKKIYFIGAGDICINNLDKFKLFGYQGVVVGSKGYDGKRFDPEIFKILKRKMGK